MVSAAVDQIPEVAQRIAAVSGVEWLAITTNASHLERLAVPLRQAGVTQLNMSLDTLSDLEALCVFVGEDERPLRGIEMSEAMASTLNIDWLLYRGFRVTESEVPVVPGFWEYLEDERFAELPGHAYTKGFLRNYGAYLGIASINHNYLPVARRWTQFVRDRLDSAAHPIVFNGNYPRPPGSPSAIATPNRTRKRTINPPSSSQ